jgi:hypothetical protein
MPKLNAPPSESFSVRLTKADKAWLEETAARHKIGVPALLVWAIEALRQYADAHGGTIPSPINIRQLWGIISQAHPELRRSSAPEGNLYSEGDDHTLSSRTTDEPDRPGKRA